MVPVGVYWQAMGAQVSLVRTGQRCVPVASFERKHLITDYKLEPGAMGRG